MKKFMRIKPKVDSIVFFAFIIAFIFNWAIIQNVLYAYATLFGALEVIDNFKSKKKVDPEMKKRYIKYFLRFPLVFFGQLILTVIIAKMFPFAWASYFDAPVSNIRVTTVRLFIDLLFLTPLREEYLFRYIPSKFKKSEFAYYGVSVVLFSYLHVFGKNPVLTLLRVPVTYAFAKSYKETEDLRVPIGLHLFNNLLTFLSTLI